MARIIGRSQLTSPTKPLFVAYAVAHNVTIDGQLYAATLVEPVALDYEILDISTADKANDPVTVVARTAINLTTGKIGVGRFSPTWTVPTTQALGRHVIRFFATMVEDGEEIEWSETFDVLATTAGLPTRPLYALPSQVREEGVGASVTDRRIVEMLARACDRLDDWTGRTFVPAWKDVQVDGDRNRFLYFNEPIIALETVVLTDGVTNVSPGAFTIYNRHLTGLTVPDDRETPHIEFRSDILEGRQSTSHHGYPSVFGGPQWGGRSPQAIRVKGIFGFTDADGSPTGRTPSMAEEVATLMTLRNLPKQNTQEATMKRRGAFVSEMKTREQTVKWGDMASGATSGGGASSLGSAPYTGDPYIDGLIAQLTPAAPGAVV